MCCLLRLKDIYYCRLQRKLLKANWILHLLLLGLLDIMQKKVNRWAFACTTMLLLQQVICWMKESVSVFKSSNYEFLLMQYFWIFYLCIEIMHATTFDNVERVGDQQNSYSWLGCASWKWYSKDVLQWPSSTFLLSSQVHGNFISVLKYS